MATQLYRDHSLYRKHLTYRGESSSTAGRSLYRDHSLYRKHVLYRGVTGTTFADDASNQFSNVTGTATLLTDTQVTVVGAPLAFHGTGTLVIGGGVPTIVGAPLTFAGTSTMSLTGFVNVPLAIATKPTYEVVIADMDNVSMDTVPFSELSLSYTLDEAGVIEWRLPIRHPKTTRDLLTVGARTIKVFRNGQKVWGGYLTGAAPSVTEGTVRFRGAGWLSRLGRRHIDSTLIFEDKDQLDIAWDIIAYVQSRTYGDLGIKRLSGGSSNVTRTRRYHSYDRINVLDELQTLAATNDGFDFDITPDRFWRTFSPRRGRATNYLFEQGANVNGVEQDESSDELVSEISGMGGGQGATRCIAVVGDADALTTYGLVQDAPDYGQIKHFPTLLAAAKEDLRVHRKVRALPQLTVLTNDPPFSGAYDIGDECHVKVDYGYIKVDRNMRIVSQSVTLAESGQETVSLLFDEPWNAMS